MNQNPNDASTNGELNVKMLDFSLLQPGEKFFTSRLVALDNKAYYVKTATSKTSNGSWINAKNAFGLDTFIKYDQRVWVRA